MLRLAVRGGIGFVGFIRAQRGKGVIKTMGWARIDAREVVNVSFRHVTN